MTVVARRRVPPRFTAEQIIIDADDGGRGYEVIHAIGEEFCWLLTGQLATVDGAPTLQDKTKTIVKWIALPYAWPDFADWIEREPDAFLLWCQLSTPVWLQQHV